ncbi:MAG: hypothetical protein QOD29_2644, partial [Alphaproteobacteria bacterium]|nr:hypothetical protein [Alphaproteobacteria bacterium]
IGEGADRLLPAFLPKGASKARKKEIEDYRSHLFKTDFLPRVQPFPKVKELFERIKKDGRKVALASSCTEEEIAEYEKIAAISDIVDCESTSDDAPSSKPAPDIFLKAVERVAPITANECGDRRHALRRGGGPQSRNSVYRRSLWRFVRATTHGRRSNCRLQGPRGFTDPLRNITDLPTDRRSPRGLRRTRRATQCLIKSCRTSFRSFSQSMTMLGTVFPRTFMPKYGLI